ncbi:MAG: hypothetical protein PHV42_00105 [Candidatus Pacebacteria bacterium]|nr:hypothetical protein [Candidatus Paceibacterota bacterium]
MHTRSAAQRFNRVTKYFILHSRGVISLVMFCFVLSSFFFTPFVAHAYICPPGTLNAGLDLPAIQSCSDSAYSVHTSAGGSCGAINDFKSLVACLTSYLGLLIPLLVGLAVVGFLYGVLRYIYSGGDEEKRKEGVRFMTYGIVGLAVITTLWALVGIISLSVVGKSPILPQLTP